MSHHIPGWELTYPLYPRWMLPNSIKWVQLHGASLVPEDGQPILYTFLVGLVRQGYWLFVQNLLVSLQASYMLILGCEIGSQCHSPTLFCSRVLDWVKNKVDVHDYFRHFTGSIKVNVSTQICHLLEYSETILLVSLLQDLSHILSRNASQLELSQCGRGFKSAPPHLVMRLTVEPTKARLCNDNRFLYLWMQDRPFWCDH